MHTINIKSRYSRGGRTCRKTNLYNTTHFQENGNLHSIRLSLWCRCHIGHAAKICATKKNEGENLKCFSQVLETDNRFQTHNIPRRWWWCWLSKLFAIDWRWHCLSVRGSLLFDFHCSLVSCCSSYLEIGNIVFARWENSSA